MSVEKRRSPRVYRRFILRAALSGEGPLRWSFVTIHDLSATGVLFTYDRPVKAGARLELKIDFPDRIIECQGIVVRVGGTREGAFHDVAARLENIYPTDQQYIEGFVRQNTA